jgi:DNA mismatch repair ATPase MutS
MKLIDECFETLELDYILQKINPLTPYGKEYITKLLPSSDRKTIEKRLDLLEESVQIVNTHKGHVMELRNYLKDLKEIRFTLRRAFEKSTLSEVELYEMKEFSLTILRISSAIDKLGKLSNEMQIKDLKNLREILDPKDERIMTFHVYDEYSDELKRLRKKKNILDSEYKEKFKLLVDYILNEWGLVLRANGEIIVEKSSEVFLKVKTDKRFIYESENSLVTTFKLNNNYCFNELYDEILLTKESIEEEEYNVRSEISSKIGLMNNEILNLINNIALLDYNLSCGGFSVGYNLSRPIINNDKRIVIKQGRHIKTNDILRRNNEQFVPIDITLLKGSTVLTGANMGGKTVTLKLIGQIAYMVSMGLYVPALEVEIDPLKYIFISSGDSQSVDMGLSSFASEIVSLSHAIDNSKDYGLILVDEISRGTNPDEGYALSKAIMDFLDNRESICLFTTHLSNLTKGRRHYQVKGLLGFDFNLLDSLSVKPNDLHRFMDYTLEIKDDSADVPKDALNIASFLKLNQQIISNARNILKGEYDAK